MTCCLGFYSPAQNTTMSVFQLISIACMEFGVVCSDLVAKQKRLASSGFGVKAIKAFTLILRVLLYLCYNVLAATASPSMSWAPLKLTLFRSYREIVMVLKKTSQKTEGDLHSMVMAILYLNIFLSFESDFSPCLIQGISRQRNDSLNYTGIGLAKMQ